MIYSCKHRYGGKVNGFMWRENGKERKVPRIGPLLVGSLKPQPDADLALTRKVEAVLRAMSSGGKAIEEVAGLTPEARKVFAPRPSPAFAGMWSLSFVAAENVSGRGIKRHGSEVRRVLYYKMLTSKSPQYVLVHLSVDGPGHRSGCGGQLGGCVTKINLKRTGTAS
jgi:hypothetical protein